MKKLNPIHLLLLLMVLFTACNNDTDLLQEDNIVNTPNETEKKPNILLIIADDMGLDASPGYTIGSVKPPMPTLQNLINTGITFNNLWSNPVCTPTRSTILTGKYGFRTNVIKVNDELSTSEISIQKYLDKNLGSIYNHAVIGKWHLSSDVNHPQNMGVNYYAGALGGGLTNYLRWKLTENGESNISTIYNTTKYTDLAIDWIENQTQPWFLWLAYNAPHTPFHLPPTELHSQGNLPTDQASIDANPLPYYLAMLETMDTEMGRLISSMSSEEKENTIIIFIGDNGTPGQVAQEYSSKRAKSSLYQGGINVPMVISGKNVLRINENENSLINTTDLFATIATIAGLNISEINDSVSFNELLSNSDAKVRDYIYSEAGENFNTSDVTIRNLSHKYFLFRDGSEALYNLNNDPLETTNLLKENRLPLNTENQIIYNELVKKLTEIKN